MASGPSPAIGVNQEAWAELRGGGHGFQRPEPFSGPLLSGAPVIPGPSEHTFMHACTIHAAFVQSIPDTVLDSWGELVSPTTMFHAFSGLSSDGTVGCE